MATTETTKDPIHVAMEDFEAAKDDLHAAHFASARHSAYRHGFNSPTVTAANIEVETASRNLSLELKDAGSMIVGVKR